MNRSIADAVKDKYGESVSITGKDPAYGGDINESYVLTLSNDEKIFLKRNARMKEDFFDAEARGLIAIAKTGAIDAARPVAVGTDEKGAYLLIEYINRGSKNNSFWEEFGRKLALMHKAGTSGFVSGGTYGFLSDNYIGATPQSNTACGSWCELFRTYRLEVQFKMAWRYFDDDMRRRIGALLDGLDKWMIEPSFPSLIHGDLWGGNFMVSSDDQPVLIDPAAYVGCSEADIAMTELFGGFAPAFYDSYRAENPFAAGYSDRRDLYNLYHLLNHLNLFGLSYLSGVARIVRRYA